MHSVFPGVAVIWSSSSVHRLVKACSVTWLVQHDVLEETQGEGKSLGTQERVS